MLKGIYTPKYHQDRLYYNIFKNHWSEFVAIYEQRFSSKYGPLEEYQINTVEKFIRCGDPKHGFAYVECPNCHESFFVPFSCKTRVCNSCGEKHSLDENADPITYPLVRVNFRHINYLWRNKVLALLKNFKMIDHKTLLEYRKNYPNGWNEVEVLSSAFT